MAEHRLSYRFANALGRIKRPEKIMALMLLFVLLTVATATVTSVLIGPDWGSLWKGLLLGLLVGWLLAIFRQPALRSLFIILVVGIAYIFLSAGGLSQKMMPVLLEAFRLSLVFFTSPSGARLSLAPLLGSLQDLAVAMVVVLERVADWARALRAGEPIFDPVAAGILWSILVFFIAAWAGWLVEASGNALLAVAPAILLSVGTLSYVRSTSSTLYMILGLVLILLATVQHDRREEEWEAARVAFPAKKGRQIGSIALLLTAGMVLLSAFVSSISIQQVERWLTVQGRSAESGEGNLAKSLGILQRNTAVADSFQAIRRPGLPRDRLIGSGPELSRQLVMTVEVNDLPSVLQASRPWPLYWRSFTYDNYTGTGWRSSDTEESTVEPNGSIEQGKLPDHVGIQATIRPAEGGDSAVYAAGEPETIDRQSSAAWRSGSDLFGVQVMTTGSYNVHSLVPSADERALRAAGQKYPQWVRQRYLALPPDLPVRVRDLAIQLTAAEPTPYDRVRSIERFLRKFPYTVDVPRPPSNRDLVDYFLFDLKEGYCDYYASTMVVLARAAGVPARLAIGYASGEYNLNSGRFMVTGADAHSWVEVYFPNTGWVPFEPTASRPLLEAQPAITSKLPEEPASPGVSEEHNVSSSAWMWILLPAGVFLAGLLALAWTIVDRLRLNRIPEHAAAAEVYRRLRWYGARLAVAPGAGDTPYEYAAVLSRRLEGLSLRGIGSELALNTTRQVQAIAERIVVVSYCPVRSENSPTVHLRPQWYRLRWRLRLMLLLNYWKSWGEHFHDVTIGNPEAFVGFGRDSKAGEHEEE